ncbi:MAG TPA: hypothetical protein VFQ23_00585 [Anaerolineales bacterium]|nr:hypothetical protein [Anaerolineales bacterium]
MPTGSEQFPAQQVQVSPTTIADATAATQASPLEAPVVPAKPSFDIRLTTVTSGATIIRSAGDALEVPQDQTTDVEVNEGIEVVKSAGQEGQSYSILDFADDLEVELFGDTSVFLAELREQASGSTYANLHLSDGHIFVHLNAQKDASISVKTIQATIRSLTNGAEFDVCQTQDRTCILVKKGVVEVTPQNGKIFLVKVGEAAHVLQEQRPSPPICAPLAELTDWENAYRQVANTPALDQQLAALPQEPCPVTDTGIPVTARILYQDEFWNPFSGWDRGKIGNFNVRYAGLQYYRVQALSLANQFRASVPNELQYTDVNIDLKAIGETVSGGNFRYGLVFRQTDDQYYAFVISPLSKDWYFLKNSSAGQETLVQGTDERMRGFENKETLRVETYGSTFLLFINDRFVDLVSDSEYASGEVGLFVDAIESPDAIVRFDSITIWDMPAVVEPDSAGGREYCYNGFDDDGDRLADRADPDCQRLDRTATPAPISTNIPAQATNTSVAPNTATPLPSETSIPPTPLPTDTSTPRPTRRPTFTPTNPPPPTATDQPTATTVPPTVEPPTVEPPTVEPPTVEPPTVEPPTAEPPPTEPPAPTEPVVDPTEPPVVPTP